MKTNQKLIFSWCLILLVSVKVFGHNAGETKQAKLNYPISTSGMVNIVSSDMDVSITAWEKAEVEVIATIEFKGEDNDRARDFLDNFEEIVKSKIRKTGNELTIKTNLDEPNKVQVGSKVFGIQVGYGEDELYIRYDIKLPSAINWAVKNSYEDLRVEGKYTGTVEIDHYNGDLYAEDFEKISLNLKHGDATINSIKEATYIQLYEQELNITQVNSAKIEAKYSELRIAEIGTVELVGYESDIKFDVVNKVKGNLKYGEFEVIATAKELELTAYEVDMDISECDKIIFPESKYGNYTFESVNSIALNSSYEDEINIEQISEIVANSKYLDLEVRLLKSKLKIDGYETDIEIEEVSEKAKEITVTGKYNNLSASTGAVPFILTASIHYGDIDYPEQKVTRKVVIKEGDKLELELVPINGQQASLTFDLRGYEFDGDIE